MPNNSITTGQSLSAFVVKLVNYMTSLIVLLLGVRFFLRFAGANPSNVFAAYTYEFSSAFLVPFRGLFPGTIVEGSVFEWSTLFAMAVYAIAAYAVTQLIFLLVPRAEIVDTEHDHIDVDTLSHV
ncbi:MAG: YggT family protein [Candidatus Peribacteraceae bacterium]|nr:YggT family protein [Candidatus Peribacteraceae bacterium]